MKKVLSLVLALAMVLALGVPAFAGETPPAWKNDQPVTDSTATNVELDAEVQQIPLDVTVPAAVDPKLNPYGLEVTLSDTTTKVNDQIVSEPMVIKNASKVDVRVDVSATGKPSTGVTLATTTTINATKPLTTKSIYAYFEIVGVATATTAPVWAAKADVKATDGNIILLSNKATAKTNVITLGKDSSTDGTGATFAAFHIAGDMTPAPATAWTTDDKVTIALAFTFLPTTKPAPTTP